MDRADVGHGARRGAEGGFVALAVLDVEAASGALRTATGTVSDVCAIHPPPAV